MKRWLLILALILPFAFPLAAQNVRFDLPIYTTQAQGGNLLPVYAIPGAGIKFYSCSGSTCTTLATTYISATSSTTCPVSPTPMQVTLNGSSTCVSSADPYGNMGGWFQPGQYMATITAQGSSYNYFFTVGIAPGGGGCFPNTIANGCTGATTADAAMSNLLSNPAAGNYEISCTSGTLCIPSAAAQGLWTRYGTVIPSTDCGGGGAQEPMALPDGSGGVDLFFTCGFSSPTVAWVNAPDGKNFSAPVTVIPAGYVHGYAVIVAGVYYWYGANPSDDQESFCRLHAASRAAAISGAWTLDACGFLPVNGSGWEQDHVGNIDVWTTASTNGGPCPGNTWCAIYEAQNAAGQWSLGLASSSDGLTWTEYAGVATPSGTPTGTPSGSGGTVVAGANYAKIVAVDSAGKTSAAGSESALVTTSGGTASIAWAWTAVSGASSYRIYVGPTSGGELNYFTSGTNSFTQTQAIGFGTLGTPPSTASTGNPIISVPGGSAGGPEMHYVSASSTYFLFYHQANTSSIPTDIVTAKSTDAINWVVAGSGYATQGGLNRATLDEGSAVSQGQDADPTALDYGGGAYMYYTATDTQSPTSSDGFHIKVVTSPLTIEQIAATATAGVPWQTWLNSTTGFGNSVLQNGATTNSETTYNPTILAPVIDDPFVNSPLYLDNADHSTYIYTAAKQMQFNANSVLFQTAAGQPAPIMGNNNGGVTVTGLAGFATADFRVNGLSGKDTIVEQDGGSGSVPLLSSRTAGTSDVYINSVNSAILALGSSSATTAGTTVATLEMLPNGTVFLSGLGGSTQCLESVAGVITGTAAACGSGSGSGTVTDGSGTTTTPEFAESTSTAHVIKYVTPTQAISDLGAAPAVACTTVSSLSPANGGCYTLSTSSSVAMPSASAFTIFRVITESGATATFTGTTLSADAGCSGYLSGTTLAVTGNQSIVVTSDGTNLSAACTVTAGTGTVTSVAVSSPLGGGPITTTGTITCTTCVVASSPGAGVAHFAGSTQTVTSSAVSLTADVSGILPSTNGGTGVNNTATLTLGSSNQNWASLGTGIVKNTTITGALSIATAGTDYVVPSGSITGTAANLSGTPALPNGTTATTQSAGNNSTDLATTAYGNTVYNLIQTSGSPYTMSALTGFYWNNSSGAYSFDLPAPVTGLQLCFGNYETVANAISLIPGSGVTIYFGGIAGTAGSGIGLVSGGAAGDYICLVGTASTVYEAIGAGVGTWTNH